MDLALVNHEDQGDGLGAGDQWSILYVYIYICVCVRVCVCDVVISYHGLAKKYGH